ncbi:hypothetical protein CUN63_29695 [Pseudomonas sp. ACM7]|nr:hypothetical protein CUN63_29695 [Pseudomonas sp. ACM7]
MWERACSRLRWSSRHKCCLTHRYREQARSHRFLCGLHVLHMSPRRYLLGGIGSLRIPVQDLSHTLIYGKAWIWPIWRNARLNR